jgi:TetR/AcrR family transcriptional repressor of nem operon
MTGLLFVKSLLTRFTKPMTRITKNRILEIGAEIIHLKGYHHTGIQEIIHAAGIPKGSFYHYFASKEGKV